MCYSIITLHKDWVPALAELEQTCFDHPWTEAMFAGEFTHANTHYIGVCQEDILVAYMGMWVVADEGQITNVAVSPAHRRRGLASELIRHMIAYGKEQGLSLLTLEVRRSNESAIFLYRKMGFMEVGQRPEYYEGKEDALLMTLYIEDAPEKE